MKKLALAAALGFAACLWLAPLSPALAQSAELQRVVVTDQSPVENLPWTEEEKAETTMVQSWDEKDLERSTAAVLSDFLAEQGIAVTKSPTDQGHTLVSFRGFRTDHLSKELDGRLLFLINGHRTGTGNATQIPLVNVERIEILRGPAMLKYSASSAGGVINVVTRKGGPRPIGGTLEATYGSHDAFTGRLTLQGEVKGFDYSLGYAYQTKGSYKDAEGFTVLHTGVGSNMSFMGELGYTWADKHRLSWSTYFYDVDKAERPATYDPDDLTATQILGDSVSFRRNISNTISYTGGTLDDRWAWDFSWTFGDNLNEMYNIDINVPGATPMSNTNKRQLGQGSLTYSGGAFSITGGVDYLKYITGEGTASNYTQNPATKVWTLSNGRPLRTTGEFKNWSAYLMGDLKLLDEKVILSGALRYDYVEVSDLLTEPGDYFPARSTSAAVPQPPTSFTGSNPKVYGYDTWATKQTYRHLSPSLGISYMPWDFLKLRANWTQNFRAPSPREMFSSSQEGYGFWGYPWNKAETSNTYEFGFDLNDRWAKLSATYFYSLTKNYTYQHVDLSQYHPTDPTQNDRNRVRNADKQVRSGFDLSVSANIAGMLGHENISIKPYATISYLFKLKELYREGQPGLWGQWTNSYGTQIPKVSANYGLIVDIPEYSFSSNLNFTYYGRVYNSTIVSGVGGYRPNDYFNSFTIANLSLRKGLYQFSDYGNIELRLDITNLFNALYGYGLTDNYNRFAANPSGFYMPGRSVYAGVAVSF